MRKILLAGITFLTIFIVMASICPSMAAENEVAVKEECIAKCKEAAAMVKEIGIEATLEKLNKKDGPFVWKDTYVFSIDIESGKCLAHPFLPKAIGKVMTRNKDKQGKLYVVEFINIAKSKGEGWVDYVWPKPGEKTPSTKSTYLYKVPDMNVIMLSGIYK